HLLGAIANYQRLDAAALAPDAQFARGAREAEATIATLLSRVHVRDAARGAWRRRCAPDRAVRGGRCERSLGIGPIGQKHAWDVTPPLLATVLRPALGDALAHVLASQRAARVGEREEPDVVRRGDAAFGGKRHADRREDCSALREHADHVELRRLARAGEGTN